MTPDPTLQQRYADILAEPANADLMPMVQALDAHFAVTALPPTLSHAPMPAELDTSSLAPKTTLHVMKGSIPMEDHITTLEPRRDKMKDRAPTANRSQRRAYPLIAAVALVLVVGAFFGVQLLHQHQTGTSTPGSGVPIAKTPTAAPASYLRIDDKLYPVVTRIATTPVTNLLVGSGNNDVSVQVHLNENQTKPGDVVTAVWEVAGIPLQPLSSGEECCRHQIVTYDPFATGFNFYATLTNPGKGSVKVSYNGKLAYTAIFTITAYSTPLAIPPTPTMLTPTVAPAK